MIHNPGKTLSAADVITRRNPLHILYVSIDRKIPIDSDGEFREFLELDLEEVHVAVNLINNDDEVNMMSWEVIHKATREDETMFMILDHIRQGMPTQD